MYAPVQAADEAAAAAGEAPCVDALEAAKADESLAGALEHGDGALPSVSRRWLRFAVVAASTFLLNATSSVIIIVMPSIAADLGVSLSSVLWVSLAHSLVTCALNSGAGLLGDVVGHRRLWYAGMAVRATAQLCSGVAPSLPALVACRAAAGVGGAMDGPSGIALVLRAFPAERKPFLVALCTAVGTSAQSAGMILGALVAQRFGWRACFLAPVPLLAVIALAAPVVLRDDDGGGEGGGGVSRQLRGFDWGGTALLAAALVLYLLAIHATGGARLPFLGGSAAAALALVALERRVEAAGGKPVIALSVLKGPLCAALVAHFLLWSCYMMAYLLYPLFLQEERHFSPARAAARLWPRPLANALFSTLAGRVRGRSTAAFVIVGAALQYPSYVAVVFWLRLRRRASDLVLAAIQLFQGAGNGIASNTIIVFVTTSMPSDRIGNALGIVKTAQSVALMTGYSSTTAIVDGGGDGSYATAAYAALAVATAFLFFPCYVSGYEAGRAAASAAEARAPVESPLVGAATTTTGK